MTSSDTQASNCDAEDAINKEGYNVEDPKFKYPPSSKDAQGNPVYTFPNCFDATANIHIPPTADKKNIGIQVLVNDAIIGTMQCDAESECHDKTTTNQPTPPCFHCDYCQSAGGKKQVDYGLKTDSNFCQMRSGEKFPLQWHICPPTTGTSAPRFSKVAMGGDTQSSDVQMTIKLYMREGSPAQWNLKACKKAKMSYNVKCGNLKSIGSDTSAGNSPTSQGNPVGGDPAKLPSFPSGGNAFPNFPAFGGRK
jgi:hypothetical protein